MTVATEAMTPRRKIGITCYPTYGGSGVVATELGIELAARGHEIHFITSSLPFRLSGREANIHFHEVDVSHYPLFEHAPYDLALATRMAEVAEFYALDLLHVHYAIPHSISALLARQMGESQQEAACRRYLPFITTLHGTDITLVGLDRSYLPITQFGIEQSDGVTAISSYLRDRTREDFGIGDEIEVIHNFVNCDVYFRDPEKVALMRPRFAAPAIAAVAGQPARAAEKLLVHLSNFRPVKRVLDVVAVFARVAQAMPARLMLIGDGPDRSAAEHLAVRLGVADRVHFLGKQDNVNELLPLADLMLMPSELESFGLAALEAMACSVPAIATRVGGVPELIEDGVNGLLFAVGDTEAMGEAAVALLKDEGRLEAMAAAARKTARERFCSSKIIPQYEAYYERVIARGQASRGQTAKPAEGSEKDSAGGPKLLAGCKKLPTRNKKRTTGSKKAGEAEAVSGRNEAVSGRSEAASEAPDDVFAKIADVGSEDRVVFYEPTDVVVQPTDVVVQPADVGVQPDAVPVRPALDGRRILVTRSAAQASELSERLTALGATVIQVPTIEIGPPSSFDALDAALAEIGKFDLVAFTSGNAVEAFHRRAEELKIAAVPRRIAVVGPATERAVEAIGLRADVVPPVFTAEALAETLRTEARGRRILLVLVEDGPTTLSAALKAAGAHVTVAAAYANRVPERSIQALTELFAEAGNAPDAVTFTSASTARNLVALLKASGLELPESVARASIGPVTSRALDVLGLPAHLEAAEPSLAALAEVLASRFRK
jgi:N-acetyl-alpha-D-glucosaminyl L-malate synthase BshA